MNKSQDEIIKIDLNDDDISLIKNDNNIDHEKPSVEKKQSVEDVQHDKGKFFSHIDKETRRMWVIKSHRRRKNLCESCGKNVHVVGYTCKEDYTRSDMRTDEEIKNDPRKIVVPKKAPVETITQKLTSEKVNEQFLKSTGKIFFYMKKTADVDIMRPIIIIDVNCERADYGISHEYINYMCKRYINHTIFLFGNADKLYSYFEIMNLKKNVNIKFYTDKNLQDRVNMLYGCKHYFGMSGNNVLYCMLNNIPSTIFLFDYNELTKESLTIPYVVSKSNFINLEDVKNNVLSYRIEN